MMLIHNESLMTSKFMEIGGRAHFFLSLVGSSSISALIWDSFMPAILFTLGHKHLLPNDVTPHRFPDDVTPNRYPMMSHNTRHLMMSQLDKPLPPLCGYRSLSVKRHHEVLLTSTRWRSRWLCILLSPSYKWAEPRWWWGGWGSSPRVGGGLYCYYEQSI